MADDKTIVGDKPIKSGEIEVRNEKGQFVKGHIPTGHRPKGSVSITSALKRMLEQKADEGDRTKLDLLVLQIVDSAIAGDPHAQRLLLNYVEGMPRNKTVVEFEGKTLAELFGVK